MGFLAWGRRPPCVPPAVPGGPTSIWGIGRVVAGDQVTDSGVVTSFLRSPRSKVLLLAAMMPLLAGCESLQEAEPVAKTVPVATMLVAVPTMAFLAGVLRAVTAAPVRDRSTGWLLPHRGVRVVRAVAAVSGGTPLAVVAAWAFVGVGFAYREPTYSMFSWEDAVGVAAIVLGVAFALAVVVLGVATAMTSSSHRIRRGARYAWTVVAVVSLALPFLLVWTLPLAIAGHVAGTEPEPELWHPPRSPIASGQ